MASRSANSRLQRQQHPSFVNIAHAQDGSRHSIGITKSGIAYSWGMSNELGQLGRKTVNDVTAKVRTSNPVELDRKDMINAGKGSSTTGQGYESPRAVRAYAGGTLDTGHSAILDSNGDLWMAGCDRWQQLGLGSPAGGATGYTWGDGGKIWRDVFVRNDHLSNLLKKNCSRFDEKELLHDKLVGFPPGKSSSVIRDVALGGDHSVVLASNRKDVYTFGKGSEGQLGHIGKPFVSALARSTILSSRTGGLAAVCAIRHCSISIDGKGTVVGKAGRCNMIEKSSEFAACISRAEHDGLLQRNAQGKESDRVCCD